MRIRLKSGEVILFKKENPILIDVVIDKYYIYYSYDQYNELFLTIFKDFTVKFRNVNNENLLQIYNSEGLLIARYEIYECDIYVNSDLVWDKFKNLDNLKSSNISVLLMHFVETHLKLKCSGAWWIFLKGQI